MKTRIHNRWKNYSHASLEQRANVLAYNIWQISLTAAIHLHKAQYLYPDDITRIGVIQEYMILLVHVADRLTYARFNHSQRQRFMSQLANDTARQLQRNQEQAIARGDYKAAYINKLNQRLATYATTHFDSTTPGYSMLRSCANQIQKLMGDKQVNKWIITQVIEIDGPNAAIMTRDSLNEIFKNWNFRCEPTKKTNVMLYTNKN